jgi:hypothetical protein
MYNMNREKIPEVCASEFLFLLSEASVPKSNENYHDVPSLSLRVSDSEFQTSDTVLKVDFQTSLSGVVVRDVLSKYTDVRARCSNIQMCSGY